MWCGIYVLESKVHGIKSRSELWSPKVSFTIHLAVPPPFTEITPAGSVRAGIRDCLGNTHSVLNLGLLPEAPTGPGLYLGNPASYIAPVLGTSVEESKRGTGGYSFPSPQDLGENVSLNWDTEVMKGQFN